MIGKNRVQRFDVPSFLVGKRDDASLYVLIRANFGVPAHPLDQALIVSGEHRKFLEQAGLSRDRRTQSLKESHTSSHLSLCVSHGFVLRADLWRVATIAIGIASGAVKMRPQECGAT